MRIFFLLCFLCFSKAFSQSDLLYKSYTIEDGLESNTIFDIFQDSLGYLYVGHDKGLSKFNGRSFRMLYSEKEQTALSNITPRSNGQLICRNFQGNSFVIRNDTLQSFDPETKQVGGFPSYSQDGSMIYITHKAGLFALDSTLKATKIPLDYYGIQTIWHSVVVNGVAYVSATLEKEPVLLAIDVTTGAILHKKIIETGSKVQLYNTPKGIHWINSATGEIGTFNNGFYTVGNLFQGDYTPQTKFTDFLMLQNGTLLVATFNGLFVFDASYTLIHHYLKNIQCSALFEDKEGALWVGSLQNGLYYVPSIELIAIASQALQGSNVRFSSFAINDAMIFAGTYDGKIFQFDTSGNLVTSFNLYQNSEIQSLCIMPNHIIAYCDQLFLIDRTTQKIVNTHKAFSTKSIYLENDILYIGTSTGLCIMKDLELSCYLSSLWIKNVFPIDNQQLIIQTAEDIALFYLEENRIETLLEGGSDLCRYGDRFFFRDQESLWEFTATGGLKKGKTYASKLQHIFSDELGVYGLFSNQKMALLQPSEKPLLVGADGNWVKETMFINAIGGGYCFGNSSKIIIGTNQSEIIEPKPSIQILKSQGDFTQKGSTFYLPSKNNSLTLTMDLLPNFRDLGEGTIAYRLQKINNKWLPVQALDHYKLDLVRIPPGKYVLEIQGSTRNGSTSDLLIYTLIVAYPFYLQWWFLSLCVLFLLGIGYFSFRWRAKQMEKKNKIALEKQQMQLKVLTSELNAIRAQMNPHFIFNTLSSIQAKILNEDKMSAFENLSTFAVLLRQALQFTSEEFLSLKNELAFIKNYVELEQQRTGNAFQFEEKIDPTLDTDTIEVPSLILQPFVENSIRHGLMHSKGSKKLKITVKKTDYGICINICDNGIGRKASEAINQQIKAKHRSFATKAIYDRIDMLKQSGKMNIELTIRDLTPGTEVSIAITL
jgi:hypothetical protein